MKIFFVQFFCVFLPLLLFCFCWVHTISVLYRAHLCMKCSFGISDFLEEIPSLSHSVVLLYFFALIAEEGFLISSLLFTAICKASPDSHFAFLHFFSMGMVLIPVSCIMSRTSFHSSSGTLSIRSRPLNLFLTFTV